MKSAPDLSHLSDDDLERIVSAPKQPDLSHLSDADLDKIVSSGIKNELPDANKMSSGDSALIGLQRGTSFGFRPAIAGAGAGLGALIGNLQTDQPNESLADKIKRSMSAIPGSYEDARKGAIAEESKSMKDHPAITMGADLAGNVLTAPLVAAKGLSGALALGAIQGTGRAVSEGEDLQDAAGKFAQGVGYGAAGFGIAKGLEKGAQAVAPLIKDASQGVGDFVSDTTKNAIAKLGSKFTPSTMTEQDIKTYMNKADEISKLAKSSAGSSVEAADQLRNSYTKGIDATRAQLNGQISQALQNSDKSVDAKPILEALASQGQKLNQKLYPKESAQITDLMEKVQSLSEDGKLSVSDAHDVKSFLQDKASSAYRSPGDPASLGTEAAKAAKSGAAVARKLVNTAEPDVANANNQLSKLYGILDKMNKNLITAEKPDAALIAAGSGGNPRNAKMLSQLGDATGVDMIGGAQNLSAMKAFSNANLFPVMNTTGALKLALDTGRVSKNVLSTIMGKPIEMTESGLGKVVNFINTPQGQAVFNQVLNQQKVADGPIQRRMQKIMRTGDTQDQMQ